MPRWDWASFRGSAEALKWSRRDLGTLKTVLALVPGRTAVVQAGANLGIFPKRLAQEFATVYTFEPAGDLMAIVQHNAPEPNIVKIQAALGCDRGLVGTARVRRDKTSAPAHEGITHIVPTGTVPTLRIDDLALPVCDLIYLDIEGYELFALRGAVETLRRCRPVLAVEINKNLRHMGIDEADVVGFIESHGYRHACSSISDQVFVPAEWDVCH